MVDSKLKKYIDKNIMKQYKDNNYGGHGWEHIQDVINRSFELKDKFNLDINPNMVYVIAAYHDIGYRQDPDNHEKVSSEMFLENKEMKKYFSDEERNIIAEAIVDHRASLEYEARSIYGKLVSSADRAIDVKNMLRRSIAFQAEKHKSENPSIEEVIEYSFKKLSSKYGNGGYAKMYYEDDKYKDYIKQMNKLFSNKNKFIKAEKDLIESDKELQKYFEKELKRRNIVLCGSMKVKDKILEVSSQLEKMGYNVLLPVECMQGLDKVIASRAHFDRISNPENDIILIVNVSKNGIDNYIGPNSFAEIAFGFYFNKKVFLLNDIYEPYKDEIIGWKVECLNGDLSKIDN